MISQFIRPATRLRPAPISVRRNRAFRPASLLGLDELESRVVLSVTLSVTAAPFYADPSGVKDSSAAIQNCINAVHAAGGGTVSFPAGTYKISFAGAGKQHPAPCSPSHQISPSQELDRAPPNSLWPPIRATITTSSTASRPRIQCHIPGPHNRSEWPQCRRKSAQHIQIIGRPSSLPMAPETSFSDADFTNIVGVWTIAMFGRTSSVTITNNTFDNVGLNTTNMADIYDHSTIYTDAANITITGNTFTGRLVNGTTIGAMGATTAIEIHGYNQNITNNTVSNYSCGVNVASSNCGYPNTNQFYQNNTFTNVGTAFALWP